MKLSSIAGVVILLAVGTSPVHAQPASGNIVVTGVQLTNPQLVGNVLTATGTVTGTLAGLPFTTDITNLKLRLAPGFVRMGGTCAVLDLHLGPINLALLGLFVDTSEICLKITAIEGGGILGDLLCDLSGLNLGGIVGGLTNALPQILTSSLGNSQRTGGGGSVCTGECQVLDLVLGPVDLTVLGLNVVLDNCNNGPVEICISASRGEGILGDLLCGLTGPQLLHLDLADITRLVSKALQLLPGGLTRQEIATLTALLGQLLRA